LKQPIRELISKEALPFYDSNVNRWLEIYSWESGKINRYENNSTRAFIAEQDSWYLAGSQSNCFMLHVIH